MGDLHSIAYSSFHNYSPLAWDLHSPNLGAFNSDISQFFESSISCTPPLLSQFEPADFSTGYLQDALFEFNSKRRRLEFCSNTEVDCKTAAPRTRSPDQFAQNSQISMTCFENYEDQAEHGIDVFSRESAVNCSNDSHCDADKENRRSFGPIRPSAGEVLEKRKKRNMSKIVYPFELVKPGGTEGEVTLHDINERILMPPTRPVRHPVGDFASRSLISPDGPGLSGKAVVALTRIHTRGRGTITIIRTKD